MPPWREHGFLRPEQRPRKAPQQVPAARPDGAGVSSKKGEAGEARKTARRVAMKLSAAYIKRVSPFGR